MISEYKFLKEVERRHLPQMLNLDIKVFKYFHGSADEYFIQSHAKNPDWPKILEIEEKFQWPILMKLDDPCLPIYEGGNEKDKSDFISSVRNEKQLRKRFQSREIIREEYERELKSIIMKRLHLMRQIFEVETSNIKLYILLGLGLLGAGYATKKVYDHVARKEETKKTEEKK